MSNEFYEFRLPAAPDPVQLAQSVLLKQAGLLERAQRSLELVQRVKERSAGWGKLADARDALLQLPDPDAATMRRLAALEKASGAVWIREPVFSVAPVTLPPRPLLRNLLLKEAADDVPTVAVDVDGTLAEPFDTFDSAEIPAPREGAVAMMREFRDAGYRILIWTCRDADDVLKGWLEQHDIPYDELNANSLGLNRSPKIMADLYLDDRGVNAGDLEAAKQEVHERLRKKNS